MRASVTLAFFLLCAAGLAAAAGPAAAQASISGEVLETRDVALYTYLRLKTRDGEIWAAVTKAPVKKGAQVTVDRPVVMQNFESKALKKTFDKIAFGTLAGPHAPPSPAAASPHGAMGGGQAGTPAPAVPIKLAKAAGPDARTVAEVVAGKDGLKDKPVSLRGQVVKVSNGIMGKNWLHVQDGSGTAGAGTNDLLVTSTDTAAVGDVVNVKGTVRTKLNLGSGYEYAVLVEAASLRK